MSPILSANVASPPFDRQIIAQALVESVPVVTPDESFKLYEGLGVVW